MTQISVAESRDIDASASRIFSIVSDPAMHPVIDGTGMLRGAADDQVISGVGDVFFMSMTHWHRGNYTMENLVVEFEQDRYIAWEPVAQISEREDFDSDGRSREPRSWGWQLEPLSSESTRVTTFFDGSRLSEGLKSFIRDGEFWRPAMVISLENLEKIATAADEKRIEIGQSATALEFIQLFEDE